VARSTDGSVLRVDFYRISVRLLQRQVGQFFADLDVHARLIV